MLTEEEKKFIFLSKNNNSAKELASKYNISIRTVYKIWSEYELDQDPEIKKIRMELKKAICKVRIRQIEKKSDSY